MHTGSAYFSNYSNCFAYLQSAHAAPQPKLYELDLIEASGKTVKVIEQAAAKWEKVATRLYFESHDISRIRKDYHQQTIEACRTVFIEWLQGKGRKPTTWDTVIKALEEADLSELAGDLKVELYTCIIVTSTLLCFLCDPNYQF